MGKRAIPPVQMLLSQISVLQMYLRALQNGAAPPRKWEVPELDCEAVPASWRGFNAAPNPIQADCIGRCTAGTTTESHEGFACSPGYSHPNKLKGRKGLTMFAPSNTATFSIPNTSEKRKNPVPVLTQLSPNSAHPAKIWAFLSLLTVPVSFRESQKQAAGSAGRGRSFALSSWWHTPAHEPKYSEQPV